MRRWTTEEDKIILKLTQQGMKTQEIGEILNRTTNSIRMRLQRLNYRKNNRWTKDEDDRLKQLRIDGYTYLECAEILNRTYNSISHRVNFLGITKLDSAGQRIRFWAEENRIKMEGK